MPIDLFLRYWLTRLREWWRTGTDWLDYALAELRNKDKDIGWKPGEMTRLLTGMEEDREHDSIVRARRDFWKGLTNDS